MVDITVHTVCTIYLFHKISLNFEYQTKMEHVCKSNLQYSKICKISLKNGMCVQNFTFYDLFAILIIIQNMVMSIIL